LFTVIDSKNIDIQAAATTPWRDLSHEFDLPKIKREITFKRTAQDFPKKK
jgi:hypothetical protein